MSPARVPATFQLEPGGRLSPPTISIPAFLAIAITFNSHDSRSHTVKIVVPSPQTLTVPAHGGAGAMLRGLRAGQYKIEIDGQTRGTLSIGGEPGP